MRAAFAVLIIELLIQLPGPNQWKPLALASPFAGEAAYEVDDRGAAPLPDALGGEADDEVIKVQLFEDDVVHEDPILDHHRVMAAPPGLTARAPDEPHRELDIPPPQRS